MKVDVFDKEELLKKAIADPLIADTTKIEDVDFCGSAAELKDLLIQKHNEAEFVFICSSHNFEHIPNPIKHLKDCDYFLKTGRILYLALPDMRACFDRARLPTRLNYWLKCFFENKISPDPFDLFDFESLVVSGIFSLHDKLSEHSFINTLSSSYESLKQRSSTRESLGYTDCHVSAFTPSSLLLLCIELLSLKLINLVPILVTSTFGLEFIIHFVKVETLEILPEIKSINQKRIELHLMMLNELSQIS